MSNSEPLIILRRFFLFSSHLKFVVVVVATAALSVIIISSSSSESSSWSSSVAPSRGDSCEVERLLSTLRRRASITLLQHAWSFFNRTNKSLATEAASSSRALSSANSFLAGFNSLSPSKAATDFSASRSVMRKFALQNISFMLLFLKLLFFAASSGYFSSSPCSSSSRKTEASARPIAALWYSQPSSISLNPLPIFLLLLWLFFFLKDANIAPFSIAWVWKPRNNKASRLVNGSKKNANFFDEVPLWLSALLLLLMPR